MKITIWDIFGYLWKWRLVIVVLVALSLFQANRYVESRQTHTAETVIRYLDSTAESGLTPSGSELDVYEILSPNVISGAIADLNLGGSVEAIRARLSITSIIPDAVAQIRATKLKEGKDYTYFPTDYLVKYTVGNTRDGEYARDVLDAVVKNYSVYYSEKYLNRQIIPQNDFDIETTLHDYLEIAEVMKNTVDKTARCLEDYETASPAFRSPVTGMSFTDLRAEYAALRNFNLPQLFETIFNHQITRDKEKLLKKYAYRKEQYLLRNTNKAQEAKVALTLMKAFVNSNKDVPNAYHAAEDDSFGTNTIYSGRLVGRSKTTYDKLVDNYVFSGVDAQNLFVDAKYCDSVIAAFSTAGKDGDNSDANREIADREIRYIQGKLEKLYHIADDTVSDYNDLTASNNIASLSGISIKDTLSKRMYLLVALAVSFGFGTVLAVAVELIMKYRKVVLKLKK